LEVSPLNFRMKFAGLRQSNTYQKRKENMAKKIYIGNLSYKADEDSLREVFAKMGEVQSVKIITDAATGQSRGFGFVEMTSDEDADKAIAALNGTMFMNRALVVSEARPQAEKGRRGSPGRQRKSFGGGGEQDNWRYR
jgi:RNA recognition motif-containing protein